MMREQGNGKRTEKVDDVNWIESIKDMSSDTFWCFMIRVCFKRVGSSLSVKFLVFRSLKHVENVGLLKYHTNRLIEVCGWICYLHLPLNVHSNQLFLSKK